MKSIRLKLIEDKITILDACEKHYNELTEEDIDYIVKRSPWDAAELLNQHPLLTYEDVDYIVENSPWYAAEFLNQHPFLTQEHVDFIIKKDASTVYYLHKNPYFKQEHVDLALKSYPWTAVDYLSHLLSEENITWLAENRPYLLKDLFK